MSGQKKADVLFILLLVLLVLSSVGTTCYFIFRHHKNVDNKSVTNTNPSEEETPYLEFAEVSRKDTIDIYREYPVNPIDINLVGTVRIHGLKDKIVEEKVNAVLRELPALESEDDYGCYVNFNVSNVLSITCDDEARNIDLTTGEEIKFEELFNQDTNMDALIRKEAYQYACFIGGCYAEDPYDEEYESEVENDMIAFLRDYKNEKSTFGIGYTDFNFYRNQDYGWYYYSSYASYYDELTIYDRFLTDGDIYEEEVSLTCFPQTCHYITDPGDNKFSYQTGEFLSETNYLDFQIYNSSGYNLAYDDFTEYPFDMREMGNKIKDQLIDHFRLDRTDHYKNIYLSVNIYNNELNGYQLEYNLTIQELDEDNFYESVLNYELETEIDREETYKADIIMDQEGNISFLEDDPTELFPNFESVLYQYIMDDLAKALMDDHYYSEFENYNVGVCEEYTDYNECLNNRDFHELIKDANYAVDPVNERIHMYHMVPGIGAPQSYVHVFLPFSLFQDSNQDLE